MPENQGKGKSRAGLHPRSISGAWGCLLGSKLTGHRPRKATPNGAPAKPPSSPSLPYSVLHIPHSMLEVWSYRTVCP